MPARARYTDPLTSHQAARSIREEDLREQQRVILRLLREIGPLTDERILVWLHRNDYMLSPSGARTRRKELVDLGFVEDSGFRGKTASGRTTIVWQAVKLDPEQISLI